MNWGVEPSGKVATCTRQNPSPPGFKNFRRVPVNCSWCRRGCKRCSKNRGYYPGCPGWNAFRYFYVGGFGASNKASWKMKVWYITFLFHTALQPLDFFRGCQRIFHKPKGWWPPLLRFFPDSHLNYHPRLVVVTICCFWDFPWYLRDGVSCKFVPWTQWRCASADMAFLPCFPICTPSMCVNFQKSHLKTDTQRLSTPLQLVSLSITNFEFRTGFVRNGKKTHVPWHGKLAEICIWYWSQTRDFLSFYRKLWYTDLISTTMY